MQRCGLTSIALSLAAIILIVNLNAPPAFTVSTGTAQISSVEVVSPAAGSMSASSLTDDRRKAVIRSFLHAWQGYERYAWGRDEVRPLTHSWNDAWGGFAVTMVDALDTAMLMGLDAEAERAIAWLSKHLHFDRDHYVSVFEMTIRSGPASDRARTRTHCSGTLSISISISISISL